MADSSGCGVHYFFFTSSMSATTHIYIHAHQMCTIFKNIGRIGTAVSKFQGTAVFSFKERCLTQPCVVGDKIPNQVIMSCWTEISLWLCCISVTPLCRESPRLFSAGNVKQNYCWIKSQLVTEFWINEWFLSIAVIVFSRFYYIYVRLLYVAKHAEQNFSCPYHSEQKRSEDSTKISNCQKPRMSVGK